MLPAESNDGARANLVRALADDTLALGRNLRLIESPLRLTPDVVVDALMQDEGGRPVLVLGEAAGGGAGATVELLGRAWCVLAEVKRARPLLERLFRAAGARFDLEPRVLLVGSRFADALHGVKEALAANSIELVEVARPAVESKPRIPVTPTVNGPARELPQTPREPVAEPVAARAPVSAPKAPTRNGTALLDELKRKVVHLNDHIAEEVEGGTIRFRFRDELLAIVTTGDSGLQAVVGEGGEPSRPIADRGALQAVLDEIVRRYFTLSRAQRSGTPRT